MIDNIKLANYKSFFADQVKEAIDEQQKINRSQMRNLFKTGELSLAYVDSIQHETGMIILKCPRRMAPRLKVLKGVCIIKKGAKQALGEHVTEWICRWDEFVDNKDFHSSGSDMTQCTMFILVIPTMTMLHALDSVLSCTISCQRRWLMAKVFHLSSIIHFLL